ncbi:MAG TPA: cation transporter [Haloplasmataceae bacterium]
MKKILHIEGMSCKHCVKHVTNALEDVEGVNSVEVSLEKKLANVDISSNVTDEDLVNAVVDAGYEVIKIE